MKQLFSILTAVIMMFCLLTTGALAADASETETAEHIHVFDQKTLVTASTCQIEGVIISLCSGEGECELPNRMWSEPLPKSQCIGLEDRLGVREASCEQDGYTGDIRCKWCLNTLEEGEVIPATGHSLGDWVTDAWKSDETVTVQYSFCTVCKQLADTREVPTDPDQLPEVPQVHDHAFEEAVVEIEPTCQTEGLSVKRCTADGYCDYIGRTTSEVLPTVECTPTDDRIGQSDASCLSKGYTGDTICKWCLSVIEKGEVIPATGHTPGEWITDELLSSSYVTVQYQKCETCDMLVNTKTELIIPEEPETPTVPDVDVPFTDVYEDAYYYDAVQWAVGHDITSGTSETTFSPNMSCTRGQVVTFLWRSAGSPEPTSKYNPFTDVNEGDYYYKAVLWAVERGITSGTSLTTFSPDQSCTRAQVVTFLWRSEGSPETERSLDLFIDVDKDDYYHTAVIWAAQNDITGGTSFFVFSPDNVCTRAQIVTFLYKASQI